MFTTILRIETNICGARALDQTDLGLQSWLCHLFSSDDPVDNLASQSLTSSTVKRRPHIKWYLIPSQLKLSVILRQHYDGGGRGQLAGLSPSSWAVLPGFSWTRLLCSFFSFWPRRTACGILAPQPGIEAGPSAVRAHTPNHWASREFPVMFILYELLHEAKFSLLERAQFTLGTLPSPYSGCPSRPALCQSGPLILTSALLYKAFPQPPKLLFSSTSLLIHLFLTVKPWLAETRKRASCSGSR